MVKFDKSLYTFLFQSYIPYNILGKLTQKDVALRHNDTKYMLKTWNYMWVFFCKIDYMLFRFFDL